MVIRVALILLCFSLAAAGDSFALFLQAVLDAIQQQDWRSLTGALLEDARFLHRLRLA